MELSGGFGGRLANNEVSFMILDGVMIMIACFTFSILHPGYGFTRAGWAAAAYPFVNTSEEGRAKDKARQERQEARRQAILDAKLKRFSSANKGVPTAELKSDGTTVQVSDGSLSETKEASKEAE